jgi:hypothetical protein
LPTLKGIIKLLKVLGSEKKILLLFWLPPLARMLSDKCEWEDKVQSVAAPIA